MTVHFEQEFGRIGENGADVSCVAYHALLLARCRGALKVSPPTPQQHPQQPGPSGTGGHHS